MRFEVDVYLRRDLRSKCNNQLYGKWFVIFYHRFLHWLSLTKIVNALNMILIVYVYAVWYLCNIGPASEILSGCLHCCSRVTTAAAQAMYGSALKPTLFLNGEKCKTRINLHVSTELAFAFISMQFGFDRFSFADFFLFSVSISPNAQYDTHFSKMKTQKSIRGKHIRV